MKDVSDSKCMRCGSCCKQHFCIVPKYEHSDLSPDHIDSMEPEDAMAYIDEHSEPQGDVCKWLIFDKETMMHSCGARERRSSMCRDHRADEWCNIGFLYWEKLKAAGYSLPPEIQVLYDNHPMHNYCKSRRN